MIPFVKLDFSLPGLGVACGDTRVIDYGIYVDGTFRGIAYNDVVLTNSEDEVLLELVPEEIRDQFIARYITINSALLPHTDSGVRTVINVYLDAGGYVTSFDTPKEGAKPFKLANQTDGIVYDFTDVDSVFSFAAEDGDVYILDVSKLHSVRSGAANNRTAFSLGTHLPFEVVAEAFRNKWAETSPKD